MSWLPGDPWPGTPGGAHGGPSYPWGTPIRLYVRAGLAAGRAWTMGTHPNDRLDAGNVMGPVAPDADPPTIEGRLWIDLSCDTTALTVSDGSTSAAGVFSRDEAATITLDLLDPARKYDPLNTAGPYWYHGQTRLVAGVPLEVFAEVVDPVAESITRYTLFTGTADRWTHDLEPVALERRTRVVATGAVKALANTNYEETAEVGEGDTVPARMARLVAYYGWTGGLEQVGVASGATLGPTTLAQSAWELFNRTVDDELGYVHVTPDGTIRWLTRNAWYESGDPVLTLGCAPGVDAYDIVTDLRMGAVDELLKNAVYASRSGGDMQTVKSLPSIAAHGGYESAIRRTDLGLADDAQVAEWAQTVIMLYAYPEAAPDAVTLLPARVVDSTGDIWRAVLGVEVASEFVRVVWTPHDPTAPLDTTVRVVGREHTITPLGWSIEWQVVPAGLAAASIWHIGPHPLDRLDDHNVVGYRKTA